MAGGLCGLRQTVLGHVCGGQVLREGIDAGSHSGRESQLAPLCERLHQSDPAKGPFRSAPETDKENETAEGVSGNDGEMQGTRHSLPVSASYAPFP